MKIIGTSDLLSVFHSIRVLFRGALITGYLPQELISHSIFHFVYHEDRLVKLHSLWKCVTTSASKLQWRFNARDGVIGVSSN